MGSTSAAVPLHSYALLALHITFCSLLHLTIPSRLYTLSVVPIPHGSLTFSPAPFACPPSCMPLWALLAHTGPFVCMNEPGGLFTLPRACRMIFRSFASPVPFATSHACQMNTRGCECSYLCEGMERWAAKGSGNWGGRR